MASKPCLLACWKPHTTHVTTSSIIHPFVVIVWNDTDLPPPAAVDRKMWVATKHCLPAHWNHHTRTTTPTSSNLRPFLAICQYGTCCSLPAYYGHRVGLVPSIPCHLVYVHQCHMSITTTTAACSFIVILVYKTCLLLPTISYGCTLALSTHHLPAYINLTLLFLLLILVFHLLLGIERAGNSNCNSLTKNTMKSKHFLLLSTLDCYYQVTSLIHGNTYHVYFPGLSLPLVTTSAASYSAPSSISDGALAILGQSKLQQVDTESSDTVPCVQVQVGLTEGLQREYAREGIHGE